jgi:hypothetical protein
MWEQWKLRIWGSVGKERRSRPSTEVYDDDGTKN